MVSTTPKSVERPWFRARRYGYGWTPQTWQGWLAVTAFVAVNTLTWLVLAFVTTSAAIAFGIGLPVTFVLTAALIVLCLRRGERPRWRWG